ncbi:MAG: helix-turn-helix transcriptional regulator [Paraglaciecola sp.]|nr:helix-turn-helix transcriptional regulator [Paraglaciecola sp.]NCT49487.1 helix-turn-helix transcriptional regulator [Paraglaciecola sp.]
MPSFNHNSTFWLLVRYGFILAFVLVVLKAIEYQYFSFRFGWELSLVLIAGVFLATGFVAAHRWRKLHEKEQHIPILTVKEHKLLQGLINGLSNQQLADSTFLSINTVKTHLKNIYRKLEVNNRAEAVAKAKVLYTQPVISQTDAKQD